MIVNSITDYNTLIQKCDTEVGIVVFVPASTSTHPSINKISFVYYYFDTGESYILGVTHTDTLVKYDIVLPKIGYVVNKKEATHLFGDAVKLKDIYSLWYTAGKPLPDISKHYDIWTNNFFQTFSDFKVLNKTIRINNIIPLSNWYTVLNNFCKELMEDMPLETSAFAFFDTVVIPSLASIERNGLYVNSTKFEASFPDKIHNVHKDLVHTNYNPFTLTSRPSNAYKGINYAALNKSDGSREVFESRFGSSGVLLQLDFDAYHLRLLANAMGMKLPSNSLHEVLANEYFGTSELTSEQYEEGKKMTFQFLYGNVTPTDDMPVLLRNIHKHITTITKEYKSHRRLQTLSGRLITEIDGGLHKVFNYYVQSLEAETTYKMLHTLMENLKGIQSKATLYTYDSVLFDVEISELEIVKEIIYKSIDTATFPITLSMGNNYDNLLDI